MLIVSRWLAVQLSRVAWRDLHPVEIEVAVLLIPRGLITAVLAFEIVDVRGNGICIPAGLRFRSDSDYLPATIGRYIPRAQLAAGCARIEPRGTTAYCSCREIHAWRSMHRGARR